MREKRLKGIEDKYFEWIVMEIAWFMVLIAASSVFVMMSLGYEKKKEDGYGRRLLGKVLGGKKTHYGHDEAARIEQRLAEQDANIDRINEIFEKHYGNKTPPIEEKIPAKMNRADDDRTYDKTGEERKGIPENLDDIMAAWEKGKDVEPVYHKKGHPHGV
ncbi:hypothetical protein GQ472_03755 [archaeon]|nr:hypothetical protein [archaeon]